MRPLRVIIITDCTDVAINEIRMQLYREIGNNGPEFEIEPTVSAIPFSLINCAFLVRLMGEACVNDSILYVVMNPIRDQPKRITGHCAKKDIIFIGRNTGVFGWLVQDLGCDELREISKQEYVPFGGKRIYPKTIATILKDRSIINVGEKLNLSLIHNIDIPDGTIVHIDNFGTAKLKGSKVEFSRLGINSGDKVEVYINDKSRLVASYNPRVMAGEDGDWVVYPGSSLDGMPELAKVRSIGAYNLQLKIGDLVTFRKM
jgi:S-adenosylmethionine hydrolase